MTATQMPVPGDAPPSPAISPLNDRPAPGPDPTPPDLGDPKPPSLGDPTTAVSRLSRAAFRYGNRLLVVPIHRAGLSAWFGNPLTGCQLLLTTTGRRSGRPRQTPLGYLVAEGSVWVLAGYGPATLWYRNLLEDPRVEALLPARQPFAAVAETVDDPLVRARIIPALIRSMPLPGCLIGANVWRASDERILELVAWVPLVRLRPLTEPLVVGPDDPGGLGWAWRQALVALATLVVLRVRGVTRPRR